LKKNIIKYCLIFSGLIFFTAKSIAQDSDSQLALRYYQNGEYQKAAEIYEKLYRETGYKHNRDYYLRCLFELKDFDTAEKFLKRELKKNKNDLYLQIDLGMVYYSSNRTSEADKIFKELIDLAITNRNNINIAASAFMSYRLWEYAEQVYKKGEKATNSDLSMELGNLYYIQRDYYRMLAEYLRNLERYPQNLPTIQSRLQQSMLNDIDQNVDSIIEVMVFDKIQKFPQNPVFTQLLIWQYSQTGKFRQALNQLIAIDRRSKSGEKEIIDFGILLFENGEYELALQAFEYIMAKGKDNPFYQYAYIEYLNVLYSKTTSQLSPSGEELTKLEKLFEESLSFVTRKDSYKIIYALVNIKAFYLEKYDEAINLIKISLSDRRFPVEQENILKLLLGDIYLLSGNPWDAALAYAQVEKESKEQPIGHEARLRKAKLAYYTAQFKWTQAQLDVLKASTSKLIANDALELSLFIAENYNLDTTELTMKMFARADFYFFSNKYQAALQTLDSIENLFKGHSLMDDVLYRKAEIYKKTGNLQKALDYYKRVFTEFGYDILADNAIFNYAIIQEKLRNFDDAKEHYLKLIMDYPGSIFTVDARKNLRNITDRK